MKSDDSSSVSEGQFQPSHTNSLRSNDQKSLSPLTSSSNQKLNLNRLSNSNVNSSASNNHTNASTNSSSSTTSTINVATDRAPSPSPSLVSVREREENERVERELELKRKRLQIYVFVSRCVSYPFNAKQSSDMARKHLKITATQYGVIKDRFLAFLNGKTHIETDEAFTNAVRSYYEVFLKSERISKMVQSGGFCSDDFRDVFRINIEKRVRSLPEIDSFKISKDTVLTLWMSKFDAIYRGQDQEQETSNRRLSKSTYMSASAELIMTKEQLYDMFQNVLNIKKFEHQ